MEQLFMKDKLSCCGTGMPNYSKLLSFTTKNWLLGLLFIRKFIILEQNQPTKTCKLPLIKVLLSQNLLKETRLRIPTAHWNTELKLHETIPEIFKITSSQIRFQHLKISQANWQIDHKKANREWQQFSLQSISHSIWQCSPSL